MKKSYWHLWKKYLAHKYGLELSDEILFETENTYLLLIKNDTWKDNPNKNRLINMIFPILAVYLVMINNHLTQENALADVEVLMRETFFSTQLSGIRFLNRILANPFPMIKPALRLMMRFSDSPTGQEIMQDDKNCFAIHVYQCFIHDTLKKLNAPELTPVFCATDDWLSEAMPKIQWQRSQTLGRGGEMCDFCWCRK
ncbi:MAG: L-2-amino-thiazoline-4-carboxylic acid hydrolase [Anaerolineaceae bacterium]|nr:L-2-amino-thiazoline-4-carboxylic acid hydrolase [Anaerolineaceae bacterium]